ncbi:penicillin-binding protein [Listeria weihenstephanensis FSL R9-0317]|uniref:penicillin-binding protein PBP4(5) n=1 Tax=Listeria weihenstephanensis TaxID=1006155 RepID=UPI0003E8C319|nr:penicillin-binding transpeptidase domain-containing protein [Listeria weihenstephanensis]EUJ39779.1 penicillin-binding protein [Listeria weihenstephanensis FSL R9-0317]
MQRQKKNSKKVIWISLIVVVVLAIIGGVTYYFMNSNAKNEKMANAAAENFTTNIKKENFTKLSDDVTKKSLKSSGFTADEMETKYKTVYTGIDARDIKVADLKVTYDDAKKNYKLAYSLEMTTTLGKLAKQKYNATISSEDDDWKVDWQPNLIFPGMVKSDKVRLTTDEAKRGQIQDLNGKGLAINKNVSEAGIVPNDLGEGEAKTKNLAAISKAFDIPVADLEKKLSQSWVHPDTFVPIKVLTTGSPVQMAGVSYATIETRYYPLSQAAAHLIGYVGEVSAEDIEKNKLLNVGDFIGKAGLERYYDKALRGTNGGRILIVNDETKEETVLQQNEKKDGENIKLTIDSKIQQDTFNALKGEVGSATIINPTNGNLVALVSSPSYDTNQMVAGISSADYKKYTDDKNLPFLARYATRYAPGSTFKTITAAVGLENGTTKPDKVREISGLQWQKDKSWGKYFVTRVHDIPKVNMVDALVNSDNIYFAQEGLAMGETKFQDGLKKFDFGEEFDLPFNMEPAQISNDGIKSDILLADTAYGQGELLMSPIQQAVAYTPFANNGKMVYPKLRETEETKAAKDSMSAATANTVKSALVQAVSKPEGTAHKLQIAGHNIAAKTGTAELKQKQGESGLENGFLLAFDSDKPDYLVLAMIEGVNGRGGSGLVIEKMKPVMESFYK